jgi:hypothetical protein
MWRLNRIDLFYIAIIVSQFIFDEQRMKEYSTARRYLPDGFGQSQRILLNFSHPNQKVSNQKVLVVMNNVCAICGRGIGD